MKRWIDWLECDYGGGVVALFSVGAIVVGLPLWLVIIGHYGVALGWAALVLLVVGWCVSRRS